MDLAQLENENNKIVLEIYIGHMDNTWSIETIELIDDGIFPLDDLLYHYMKAHESKYLNISFYGIYHIISGNDYYLADIE